MNLALERTQVAQLKDRGCQSQTAYQVGSHYHFFEVNRALQFDRAETFGFRLDIPAGTAIRFEPVTHKRGNFGGNCRGTACLWS